VDDDSPAPAERGEGVAAALAALRDLRRGVHLDGDLKQIAREGLD
jgi:hypothetical protein